MRTDTSQTDKIFTAMQMIFDIRSGCGKKFKCLFLSYFYVLLDDNESLY